MTLRCVPGLRAARLDRPEPLEDVLADLQERAERLDTSSSGRSRTPASRSRARTRATDDPPAPPSRLREWAGEIVVDNRGFDAAVPRRPRASRPPSRRSTASAARAPRAASASTAPSASSPARGSCASRRWSTRCRGSAPARRCGPSRRILERHPVSFPLELRFAAADDALLSPAHGRDSAYVAVHAYAGMPWEAPFREVEALLAGWDGRPHWGKRSFLTARRARARATRAGRRGRRRGRSSIPAACSRTAGRSGSSGRSRPASVELVPYGAMKSTLGQRNARPSPR